MEYYKIKWENKTLYVCKKAMDVEANAWWVDVLFEDNYNCIVETKHFLLSLAKVVIEYEFSHFEWNYMQEYKGCYTNNLPMEQLFDSIVERKCNIS